MTDVTGAVSTLEERVLDEMRNMLNIFVQDQAVTVYDDVT